MTRRTIAFAALAAFGAALSGTAFAAEVGYPRSVSDGMNVTIEYGPGARGNVVGGGAAVSTTDGMNSTILHGDAGAVQAPRTGQVPVTIGSGETATTVWVPSGLSAAQRALIGADGSVPRG